MNKVTTVGIDLAKRVFSLHGVEDGGRVVLRRLCKREELVRTVAQLPPCLIGMEACGAGRVDAASRPDQLGKDFVLVHNPLALNPISRGLFQIGREYIATPTSDEYQMSCNDWR